MKWEYFSLLNFPAKINIHKNFQPDKHEQMIFQGNFNAVILFILNLVMNVIRRHDPAKTTKIRKENVLFSPDVH